MRHETDEEIVRRIMASPESTPTEKELALRIHFLLSAYDDLEDIFINGPGFRVPGRVH